MGCWGFGSDENEKTYDRVLLDLPDRMGGVDVPAEHRAAYVEQVVQENKDLDVLTLPGVVVFLLKQGCPVPVDKLVTVRETLEAEDCAWSYPDHAEERKAVVESEIDMINAAIENNGTIPGPPMGTRGIFQAASGR